MSAARIIRPPPLSGGDRKHFAKEIHKAEVEFARLVEDAAKAHAQADAIRARAYALDCMAWNAAVFIGEVGHPSPTIATAIAGGFALLEVRCRTCKHSEVIDLAVLAETRDCKDCAVALTQSFLCCGPCFRTTRRKRRPDLIGLRPVGEPTPAAPAARLRPE